MDLSRLIQSQYEPTVVIKEENDECDANAQKEIIEQELRNREVMNFDVDEFEMGSDMLRIKDYNKMSSDSEDGSSATLEKAKSALLPAKSRERYEIVYQRFMDWRLKHNVGSFAEEVMLTYFEELSNEMKPSSLWAIYSMLRTTISLNHNINIATYSNLMVLLKQKSVGFESRKSKTLNTKEINDFLQNAPDRIYLFMKVVLIIGISGGCRKQELRNMKLEHVEDTGKSLIINIPDSRTMRSFVVSGSFYHTCKKYIDLRPPGENGKLLPLFLSYKNGRCTKQCVGINKFGTIPRSIAEYLGLPNPEQYTGHCFKRSSATILVNAGGELLGQKRLGEWRSSPVSESYGEGSVLIPTRLMRNFFQAEAGVGSEDENITEVVPENLSKKEENINLRIGMRMADSLPKKNHALCEDDTKFHNDSRDSLDQSKGDLEIDSSHSFSDSEGEASKNKTDPKTINLISVKSRERYEMVYQKFMDWKQNNNARSFSEDVLLAYFEELSNEMKPSSLWAIYSMLKSTINMNHDINIAVYSNLMALLKKKSDGFKSKKSKTLNSTEINYFLQNAPDSKYLFMKVVLIIGISGACKKQELRNIKPEHVEDTGKSLIFNIPDSKTKVRTFVVSGSFYDICKKYMDLRPPGVDTGSLPFFLNYKNEKCTKQCVGINKFGSTPRKIAEFLGLPAPEQYTGHCFRRSSATLLVNAGSDLLSLRKHGTMEAVQHCFHSTVGMTLGDIQCEAITEMYGEAQATRRLLLNNDMQIKQEQVENENRTEMSTNHSSTSIKLEDDLTDNARNGTSATQINTPASTSKETETEDSDTSDDDASSGDEERSRQKPHRRLCEQSQKLVLTIYTNIMKSEGQAGAIEKTSFLTEVSTSYIYDIIKYGPRKHEPKKPSRVHKCIT